MKTARNDQCHGLPVAVPVAWSNRNWDHQVKDQLWSGSRADCPSPAHPSVQRTGGVW